MKKLFVLLLVLSAAFGSQAQFSTKMPLAVGDTIVNTGTASKVVTVTTAPAGIVVQVDLKLLSGTGAGTVQLQTSLDGVYYTNSGSAYTITNVANQAAYFTLAAPVPQYVKVLSTGAGTESVVQTVYYRAPRYQSAQ